MGRNVMAETASNDALAELRLAIERLTQGLLLMQETQATHTEMLSQLLAAATAPLPEESRVSDSLRQLTNAVAVQTSQLETIRVSLDRLPSEIGGKVGTAVRAALNEAL